MECDSLRQEAVVAQTDKIAIEQARDDAVADADEAKERLNEWEALQDDLDREMEQMDEWEQGVDMASFEKMLESSEQDPGQSEGGQESILRLLSRSTADLRRWQVYLDGRRQEKEDASEEPMTHCTLMLKTLCKNTMLRISLNQYSEALVRQQQQQTQQQEEEAAAAADKAASLAAAAAAASPPAKKEKSSVFGGLFKKGTRSTEKDASQPKT